MTPQPDQPIILAKDNVARFQENEIITWLVDNGAIDLNEIARVTTFSNEDRRQLAQLMGYSVSGYYDLNYTEDVPDEVYYAHMDEAERVRREGNPDA